MASDETRLITSRRNPRIVRAGRLRDRGQRQKQGRFLIDGVREMMRAVEGHVELDEVFVSPQRSLSDTAAELYERLESAGVPVWLVSDEVLERLAFGQRHEGVVAVARAPRSRLADLLLPAAPLVAVLEGVEKPGNVGAIVRSADAAGVAAVVVVAGTDLYNPAAIRASIGSVFHMQVAAADHGEVIDWLMGHGLPVMTACPGGSLLYTEADLSGPLALVLGSEAHGLSAEWMKTRPVSVRLPLVGHADSLNVSAAAAVLFYEALRQRMQGG